MWFESSLQVCWRRFLYRPVMRRPQLAGPWILLWDIYAGRLLPRLQLRVPHPHILQRRRRRRVRSTEIVGCSWVEQLRSAIPKSSSQFPLIGLGVGVGVGERV